MEDVPDRGAGLGLAEQVAHRHLDVFAAVIADEQPRPVGPALRPHLTLAPGAQLDHRRRRDLGATAAQAEIATGGLSAAGITDDHMARCAQSADCQSVPRTIGPTTEPAVREGLTCLELVVIASHPFYRSGQPRWCVVESTNDSGKLREARTMPARLAEHILAGETMPFSDIVNKVIALSEATHAYWATELPKRHPEYPLVRPGEDDGPPPPEEEKLRQLLTGLSTDDLYKLALIMFLGGGRFTTNDLVARFEALKDQRGKPELVTQMVETAPLADYLLDGLEELKRHHLDVDHLLEAVPS